MAREEVTHDAATLEALEKAKILDELHDNETTRPLLFQGIKTIRPQARIPELEAQKAVLTAIEPHMRSIGEMKQTLEQERATLSAERVRDKAQRELGLSDADFAEVKKLAEERKIGDLSTATDYWRMSREAAEPRTGPETTLHVPDTKELWRNPTQWSRDEARKAMHELALAKRSRT
jgi:hypothetical protein